jgi:hypothetical protein
MYYNLKNNYRAHAPYVEIVGSYPDPVRSEPGPGIENFTARVKIQRKIWKNQKIISFIRSDYQIRIRKFH